MSNERWKSELKHVDRKLRCRSCMDAEDAADLAEDHAELDAALRDGVLVETRRRLEAAHQLGRERLINRVRSAEAVRNEVQVPIKPKGGRLAMLFQHRLLTAAAVIAIAACAWLIPISNSQTVNANTIFAQMLERIHDITFKCEAYEKTGPVDSVTTLYSGGQGLERSEFRVMGVSFVMIFRDSKVYSFDPMQHVVRITPAVRDAETGQQFLDQMKAYSGNDSAESLGLKEIDGVKCYVYRYEWIKDKPETPESESSIIEIAVDAETRYPYRIAYLEYRHDPRTKKPSKDRFEAVVIKNFEWNIKPDPALFDTSIPEGWKTEIVEEQPSEASPAPADK
ncbi:MAG: hypothetical protein H6818_09190 [Phycisphaerales bacterium]|nr:hypothetical protein [Phycisphaerales bacterium]